MVFTLLILAAPPADAMQDPPQLPDAPGKAVFEKTCGSCHSTQDVVARRRTRSGWEQVVDDMVARGAQGSADDMATIVTYLSGQFGRTNVNAATAEEISKSLGVSAKDGQAIVAYREKNGKIQDFDQLLKVPGIDLDKVREKRSWITYAP